MCDCIYNTQVGDIITTPGPDALSSCASPYGRVLQLNTEYLVGVGGPCGYFNEWSLLSSYEEEDLKTLRSLADSYLQLQVDGTCTASGLAVSITAWSTLAMMVAGITFWI